MQNIKDYPREQFEMAFRQTELYQRLQQDFDVLSFDKSAYCRDIATPREVMGSRHLKTQFSLAPFYYLNFLLDQRPKEIYDLGCGWNIFKRYLPNVIGVAAENPTGDFFHGDVHDFVDDEYIRGHQSFFQSVFSINALHFRPLSDFAKVIADFHSMIAPGGRGFLALNLAKMISQDSKFSASCSEQIEEFCREQLDSLTDIHWLVVDIDTRFIDEGLDGNVRLVMERVV